MTNFPREKRTHSPRAEDALFAESRKKEKIDTQRVRERSKKK